MLGLAGQAACFLLLWLLRNPYASVAVIVALGVCNTLSFTALVSALQERSRGAIKGRIVAVRNLTVGVLAALLIPLVTRAQVHSTGDALLATFAIFAAFAAATAALSSRALFGAALLGGRSETEEQVELRHPAARRQDEVDARQAVVPVVDP